MALVLAAAVIACVPVTHGLAGRGMYKDAWRFTTAFGGGARFRVFQGFAWAFFAGACLAGGAIRTMSRRTTEHDSLYLTSGWTHTLQ
jgi:hypothetical protein